MSDTEVYDDPLNAGDNPGALSLPTTGGVVVSTGPNLPKQENQSGTSTREKPTIVNRSKDSTSKRDKSPVVNRDDTSTGRISGSLRLKVTTQNARVAMLRGTFDRLNGAEADNFTISELDDIRASSNELWTKFSSVHDAITEACAVEFLESSYVTQDVYSAACNLHAEITARLARFRDHLQPPSRGSSGRQASGGEPINGRSLQLPKIEMPSFTGVYTEWCSFRDLFTALVRENRGITDVERMHYLRTSTSGEAAKLIASLAIEADSFSIAWETLLERYENKRMLVSSHLENLLNTTDITPRSARDLHALLHTITEACNSLKALGAPIEHWDWVLVHVISRRLDTHTRESWEVKAGQSKEPPSFADIRAFLSTRARAFEGAEIGKVSSSASGKTGSGSKTYSGVTSSRVNAVTTSDTSRNCSYCREQHYIVTCPKFRQLSNEARREEVTKQRLCFNCLGRHNVGACQVTTRCKECDRKHHTMIHTGWSKFGDTPPTSGSSKPGGSSGTSGHTSNTSQSSNSQAPQ